MYHAILDRISGVNKPRFPFRKTLTALLLVATMSTFTAKGQEGVTDPLPVPPGPPLSMCEATNVAVIKDPDTVALTVRVKRLGDKYYYDYRAFLNNPGAVRNMNGGFGNEVVLEEMSPTFTSEERAGGFMFLNYPGNSEMHVAGSLFLPANFTLDQLKATANVEANYEGDQRNASAVVTCTMRQIVFTNALALPDIIAP